MIFFRGKSVFDLFVNKELKGKVLEKTTMVFNLCKSFIVFFLFFSWIPVLFFFLSGKVSEKYLLGFFKTYSGQVEFVETSKLGSTGTVIPGVEKILQLGGLSKNTDKIGNKDLVSRIIRSDEVLKKTLFSRTELDTTVVINEVAETFFNDNKTTFPNVESPSDIQIEMLTSKQQKLYKEIISYIDNPKNKFYIYESGSTRKIMVTSTNENLSLSFPKAIFRALEDFYEVRKDDDKRLINTLLSEKKEEALAEYKRLQRELSESKKKRGLTISPARRNLELELQGKMIVAQQLYIETAKQLESVKIISEKNHEPHFKLLSEPVHPLGKNGSNKKKTILIHRIIGTFIGVVVVFFLFLLYQMIIFYRNKP